MRLFIRYNLFKINNLRFFDKVYFNYLFSIFIDISLDYITIVNQYITLGKSTYYKVDLQL